MFVILLNFFCFSFIIKNSLLKTNNKVKVYIHINNIVPVLNIYHIGVSFNDSINTLRYDIYDEKLISYLRYLPKNYNQNEKTIFWGYSDKTIHEISDYETNMEYNYVLGFQDCRHYCSNLTQWTTGKSSPIWNLTKLL
tara:strand:- start:545 stop:958 length:414 start_codon:yes stop_codon:yes gene_type:complete